MQTYKRYISRQKATLDNKNSKKKIVGPRDCRVVKVFPLHAAYLGPIFDIPYVDLEHH